MASISWQAWEAHSRLKCFALRASSFGFRHSSQAFPPFPAFPRISPLFPTQFFPRITHHRCITIPGHIDLRLADTKPHQIKVMSTKNSFTHRSGSPTYPQIPSRASPRVRQKITLSKIKNRELIAKLNQMPAKSCSPRAPTRHSLDFCNRLSRNKNDFGTPRYGLVRVMVRVRPQDHPMFIRFGTTVRFVQGVRVPRGCPCLPNPPAIIPPFHDSNSPIPYHLSKSDNSD